MKKTSLAIFVAMLSVAAAGHAQAPSSDIRESTDPAKAAEVEQRAKDIQMRQEQSRKDATSGSSGETRAAKRMKAKKSKARKAKTEAGTSGASSSSGATGASGGAQGAGGASK